MSQLNFFMTANDEVDFFAYLCARDDTLVYLGRDFHTRCPPHLDSLPSYEARHMTIVHRRLSNLYPPQQQDQSGRYSFPLFASASIEWTRSAIASGDALEAGRIFAKIGWLKQHDGNEVFRVWYAAVERWLKKSLSRLDNDWWIGSAAEAWSRAGGILAFGPGPSLRRSLASN
jgi:hypothetical protein